MAASPSPPPMSRNLFFWGGSCSASPPPSPPPGQRQAPLHQLTYRENGAAITKTTNFEELLDGLTVLESRGEAARDVEIKLLGERLKEQQCEALASKIRGGLHIKKVPLSRPRSVCSFKNQSTESLTSCFIRLRLNAITASTATHAFGKQVQTWMRSSATRD